MNGTHRFKVGDSVKLVGPGCYAAEKGATATIMGLEYLSGKPLIELLWISENPLHNNQSDGGYYEEDFELTIGEWDD